MANPNPSRPSPADEAAQASGTTHRADPAKLAAIDADRELAYELVGSDGTENNLHVSSPQPGYRYWRIKGFTDTGAMDDTQWRFIERKYQVREKATGRVQSAWQIVNDAEGQDPEDRECRMNESGPYGTCRRRGDTILLRTREEFGVMCDRLDEANRDEREGRSLADLIDRGRRIPGMVVTDLAGHKPADYFRLRRQGKSVDQITRALKEGTVRDLTIER